ncbi:MAG: alpha/beta fold hydrolase [Zoogloeaceae bacterium]|jgi:pimeloyl-[acyl-carrier protein] methyl ester esterase|nr:alpha/beta fold hydrolase [Zoogloeaceae bacterium]
MNSPAFFLPGWGLGRGPLKPLLAAASAAADWQLLDLPGSTGDAPPPATFLAAEAAILAALPGHPVRLGGWSLGGMLALSLAARHPERVKALLLVGATASFITRENWAWGLPPSELRAFAAAIHADAAAMFPRFIGNFCRGDVDNADKQLVRQLIAEADPMPQAALDAGLQWLSEADLRPLLTATPPTCPTVIAHGEHDPLMPQAGAQWLAGRLPKARLVVFSGKAHAPFAPDAAGFWQQVGAAFAELGA